MKEDVDTISSRMPREAEGDSYIHIPNDIQEGSSLRHSDNNLTVFHRPNALSTTTNSDASDEYQNSTTSLQRIIPEAEEFNAFNKSLMGTKPHRRRKCRFIKKTGHCNVSHANVRHKPQRFMADIFTTCVDLRWRWNLLLFSTAFIVSWIFFAFFYWVVSLIHGDFAALPEDRPAVKCVNNLNADYAFTSAFLFSLETQTTIGYGSRVVTEECPVSIIIVVVQSVFGCIIDAFMIGLIMAKISRPKKRAETLLFSKNACINMRDGSLCLMVRVGNLRKSHLVEATIRMQYLHSRQTLEFEFIPLEQIDLNLDLKNDSDRLFLVTPQTICHPIDADSPLYKLNKESLRNADFEIIVILEGMVEATGMTTQARASYLPGEILWGERFENVISLSPTNGYNVDFRKFDCTYSTPGLPTCSAEDIENTKLVRENVSLRGNRQITGNTTLIREEGNESDRRDSGYTAVEDYQPSDSTKTLNSTSSSGSNYSGRNYEAKAKTWTKMRQESRDNRNQQEDKLSVLTLPMNDKSSQSSTLQKKRQSDDVIEQGDHTDINMEPRGSPDQIALKTLPPTKKDETPPAEFILVSELPKRERKTQVTNGQNPDRGVEGTNANSDENLSLLEGQTPEKRALDVVSMQKHADEITVTPDKKL